MMAAYPRTYIASIHVDREQRGDVLELVRDLTQATTAVLLLTGPEGELEPRATLREGVAPRDGEVPVSWPVARKVLAEGVALFFVSPLIITVFSVIFLKEQVGPRRWAAIAVGFVGVLVVLRPGTEVFQPAALLPIAAAVGYAGLHMLTRYIGKTESALALSFYIQLSFIVISGGLGLFMGDGRFSGTGDASLDFLFRAWTVPEPSDWLVLLLVGAASSFGGFFISQAYRVAEAAVVGRRLMRLMKRPFDADGNEIYLTPSIGIAAFPDDAVYVAQLTRYAVGASSQAMASWAMVTLAPVSRAPARSAPISLAPLRSAPTPTGSSPASRDWSNPSSIAAVP